MMKIFIKVNINYPLMYEIVHGSWDKSMLFHSKKALLHPSAWPGTEYTWVLILKKSLLVCFESYQSIPYSHTGRLDRNVKILWLTLSLYVGDSLEDK